jgi:hypothetical protein
MMELVCAGTIAARNDLRGRAALDDSGSGHAHIEGFCAFRLVGTRPSFRTSGVDHL